MVTSVTPTLPVNAVPSAGSATTGLVLQPGTVVSAQVQNILAGDLVRIAIANLSIDVISQIPLQAGQTLQLAVSQTDTGIRLAVVGQRGAASADNSLANPPVDAAGNIPVLTAAAANDPLTPLQRIAVSVATETAAAQQNSQGPLFANLSAAINSSNLPPALQQAITQVLAQQTSLDPSLTGGDIQNAFQKSGLFLEASLASGAVTPPASGVPDLKAALIVLRQTLTAALGTGEGPASAAPVVAAADAKSVASTASPTLAPEVELHQAVAGLLAAATTADNPGRLALAAALADGNPKAAGPGAVLSLLQEALHEIPRAANNTAATARAAFPDGHSEDAVVHTTTPPPPFRGSLPSAQPVASASIAPDAPLAATAHRLLDDTDAAIARQTLLQVASLPDRVDASPLRNDPPTPSWNFEIPFATRQGTAMAQFEISRDGGGNEVEAAKRVWRARFSLDVEPAGPVHALVSYSGDRTSVRMWAERPSTAAQLRAGAAELSQALTKAELTPGDIVIREGSPPQTTPPKAGHFLDRAL